MPAQRSVTASMRQDKVLKGSRRYTGTPDGISDEISPYIPLSWLAALGNPDPSKRIRITLTVED